MVLGRDDAELGTLGGRARSLGDELAAHRFGIDMPARAQLDVKPDDARVVVVARDAERLVEDLVDGDNSLFHALSMAQAGPFGQGPTALPRRDVGGTSVPLIRADRRLPAGRTAATLSLEADCGTPASPA